MGDLLVVITSAFVSSVWNQWALAHRNPKQLNRRWIEPAKMSFRSWILIAFMFLIANPQYGLSFSAMLLPVYVVCSYPINRWILYKNPDVTNEENKSVFIIKLMVGFGISFMGAIVILINLQDHIQF